VLWRGYYLSFVPGFATKVRIFFQWLLDLLVGRSTVQTGAAAPRATRYVRYRAGDRVFEEGNRADGFYAVVEGAFELKVRGPDSAETVRRIGPGGHFGERVLLGEGLRTGTVRALEDSVALVVGAEDFQRLTRALPPLGTYFDEYIAATFQPDDRERTQSQSSDSADGRP
jgi:NADH dehydrogenase